MMLMIALFAHRLASQPFVYKLTSWHAVSARKRLGPGTRLSMKLSKKYLVVVSHPMAISQDWSANVGISYIAIIAH